MAAASMTPGALVRRLLGDRLFRLVVAWYRRIFVDLDAVAACIPPPPPGGTLLDIGGGDGALLEHLLRLHPDLEATLVDLAPAVGLCLAPHRRARVRLLPSTPVSECAARGVAAPDVVVLADVLHHVPVEAREELLADIRQLVAGRPFTLVLKDIAPQGWRAQLSLLSDRWITGDRHVELLTPSEAKALVAGVFPELVARDTALLARDHPNYCIVFEAWR
jgi:hypothetical protein